ncbi:addiction module antidote protein [Oligella urethralis]|uniref:addiction module antidote protein n=1 Tax=Oligella urethralis TaxID=90245 RepID=UPI00037BF71E|nr:addiction module antidote protein [Oligella urethralis]AVL70700.1 putative addiction module antidote protein [Oligella urethralis]SUA67891.1 Predicted transcriptional regulator [Oligella urethralis]
MSEKLKDFNPFDYMETQEDIQLFLEECLSDDDPNTFIEALGFLIKKHGVSEIARESGLNRESLYKVINGTSKPQWETVFKVFRALHFKFHPQSL